MSNTPITQSLVFSLNVSNGQQAIEFYQKAFGAELVSEVTMDNGFLIHAVMKIAGSIFYFSTEIPEMGAVSATTAGASPTLMCIVTDNADQLHEMAVAAGAEVLMPLDNHFWGERGSTVRDPFGYRWSIAQHIRDVPAEEMIAKSKEMMGG